MRTFRLMLLVCLLAGASVAEAAPRSGGSFGGFRGFRSGSGSLSHFGGRSFSRSVSRYGGGSSFVFLPSFGWGYGGWGYGGGMGVVGTLLLAGIAVFGVALVVRSLRRGVRGRAVSPGVDYDEYDGVGESASQAYVYKLQVGLGRSGRGVQKRLEEFANTGDTSSETGLAELLHQTALELLREKDSIRYGLLDAGGPYSLTNGEAKMNGAAMAERSRFQIERVRSTGGQVRRSQAAATVGREVLEYLVVTVLVATRAPLGRSEKLEDRAALEAALAELGGVPAHILLGLEVIWTPADPEDSLTETDLLTTYPEMRSL